MTTKNKSMLADAELLRLAAAVSARAEVNVLKQLGLCTDHVRVAEAYTRFSRKRIAKAMALGELHLVSLGERGKGFKREEFEAWASINRVI